MKTVTKGEYIILSLLYKVTVIKANDDMALVRLEKKQYIDTFLWAWISNKKVLNDLIICYNQNINRKVGVK